MSVACLASLAVVMMSILIARSGNGPRLPVERITSDTPAYCQLLLERVYHLTRMAAEPARQEATELADEGRRLCAGGEVRAGLVRLRHAVMLMAGNRPPGH